MKFNLCIVGRDMDGVKGEEGEKKKKSHRKAKQKYTTGYQNLHIKKKKKERKEP